MEHNQQLALPVEPPAERRMPPSTLYLHWLNWRKQEAHLKATEAIAHSLERLRQ